MKELTELLRELAAKLGTTVDYLWAVLIKQATIWAIQNALITVVALGLIGWGTWAIRKAIKLDMWGGYECNYREVSFAWCVPGVIAIVIAAVALLGSVPDMLTCIFNPEYAALRWIMENIKK